MTDRLKRGCKFRGFRHGVRRSLPPAQDAGRRRTHVRLSCCAVCGSAVVNPMAWHAIDRKRWGVWLRCGACAWSREAILTEAEARQLEHDLAPGLREIAAAAAKLDRERMTWQVEAVATALGRDLIGPADFAWSLPR